MTEGTNEATSKFPKVEWRRRSAHRRRQSSEVEVDHDRAMTSRQPVTHC